MLMKVKDKYRHPPGQLTLENATGPSALAPGMVGYSLRETVNDFLLTKPSLHTREAYDAALRGFFARLNVQVLEDLTPALLSPAAVAREVRAYLDTVTRRAPGDENRVLNPATVNARASALSSFFEWLMAHYGYPENPVSGVHAAHKTREFSSTESLTRGEVVDLLKNAEARVKEGEKPFRDYLILAGLFGLALRRSEVARIQWDDIRPDGAAVTVYRKGGQPQELPLPPKLAWYLGEFGAQYPSPSPYVFRPAKNPRGGDTDKPISTKAILRIVQNAAAGIAPGKRISPHSLRKTFIELALSEGEDVHSILNATGHSRVEMLRYYDTRDQLEHNAIHRMGRFL